VHIQDSHGEPSYECALGACSQESLSKFSWVSLRRHLRNNHCFPIDGTVSMMRAMDKRGDWMLIQADLNPLTTWRDCKICGKQDNVAEP
jgi:hypothetical protein